MESACVSQPRGSDWATPRRSPWLLDFSVGWEAMVGFWARMWLRSDLCFKRLCTRVWKDAGDIQVVEANSDGCFQQHRGKKDGRNWWASVHTPKLEPWEYAVDVGRRRNSRLKGDPRVSGVVDLYILSQAMRMRDEQAVLWNSCIYNQYRYNVNQCEPPVC